MLSEIPKRNLKKLRNSLKLMKSLSLSSRQAAQMQVQQMLRQMGAQANANAQALEAARKEIDNLKSQLTAAQQKAAAAPVANAQSECCS